MEDEYLDTYMEDMLSGGEDYNAFEDKQVYEGDDYPEDDKDEFSYSE